MSSPDIQPKNEEETDWAVADNPSPYEEQVSVEDNNNLQCDAVSNSIITGEFTTITNVLDGHNNDGIGEPYCSPARSKFEVVDIIDGYSIPRTASAPRSNDGSNLGSFDSYYHMQKNGPQIIPETDNKLRAHSIMRYGWRGGGMSGLTGSSLAETNEKEEAIEIERFCEDASETNTNDRASSLSSLTNDFFPKMSRKEGFFTPKRSHRKTLSEIQGSNSPTSSSYQSLKIFPKSFSPPRSKRNNIVHESPWYLNKHHRGAPSPQNSSDQTPITTHPPGEVLVTPSQKASDSGPTPSVISSSNISQYFTNELREMYNSNVYRSYRHRYDQALSSPRAKRVIFSSIILAALFAVIAIIAITLDARSQNRAVVESSAVSYYDMKENGGLPEKCCIDKLVDNEKLLETDTQDRIESSTTNDEDDNDDVKEEVTSPAPSSVQNILPDWDYVIVLTPNPTVGAAKVPVSASTQLSPSPTPGQDSGWKPSIVPSLQILTMEPTRRPSRRPTRRPSRRPTRRPSRRPTARPSRRPSKRPTTKKPTPVPTKAPILSTPVPTPVPTEAPTLSTGTPTPAPTVLIITQSPTLKPSLDPVTEEPTIDTSTNSPTLKPIISVSILIVEHHIFHFSLFTFKSNIWSTFRLHHRPQSLRLLYPQ